MCGRIRHLAKDSDENRLKIRKMRETFRPELIDGVHDGTRAEALTRGMETVQGILSALKSFGIDPATIEPAHGPGHWLRDYVNALRLFSQLNVTPAETFIGFVAGSLHDVGCTLVYRFDEAHRLVRHAEVAALLLEFLFELDSFALNKAEQLLIRYGMAAHTHYLRTTQVKDKHGNVIGAIEPYFEMVGDKPFYPVWMPRWVDRLDTNGPAYVGRHYVTLAKEHQDFDGKNYYDVDFVSAMRPLLRTKEERGNDSMTMAEHLRMYAETQNNDSPYGKHDFGAMIELRDAYKARIRRVIEATQMSSAADPELRPEVLQRWKRHLAKNIEPYAKGEEVAGQLTQMFLALPEYTQRAWQNAFNVCLDEYRAWSDEAIKFLETIPVEYRSLPGVCDNLQSMLLLRG